MVTTLLNEKRISLTQVAREQCVAPATAWRWAIKGVRGHKLESFVLGGRRYSTIDALERFVAATSGSPALNLSSGNNHDATPTTGQRERAIDAAEQELIQAGA